jgi:hypothetical protein
MKQAAVQSSAAGSAAVNSSLNDSGSMVPAVNDCEPNAESWINRNRSYYELLIALEVTWRCQEAQFR